MRKLTPTKFPSLSSPPRCSPIVGQQIHYDSIESEQQRALSSVDWLRDIFLEEKPKQ